MPKISKARFVIAVPNLKSSSTFYRDVLGFTIHTIPDPGFLFYTSGDCTIVAGSAQMRFPLANSVTIPTSHTCKLKTSTRFMRLSSLLAPRYVRRFEMSLGG
jgi:hypothetical protein